MTSVNKPLPGGGSDRMQAVDMQSLLLSEEEKLRGELRADAVIDKNRIQILHI